MSASAHVLEDSIATLQADPSTDLEADVENNLILLANKLVPILHFLEGTPIRAIIVAAVVSTHGIYSTGPTRLTVFSQGLWSLVVITYLFFAHRSKNHQATNRRWIRVLLELLTLLAWIASIVCSILLALEFGVTALVGGPELKGAAEVCEVALEQAIQQVASTNKNSNAALNIVETLITIGALSIASVVVSGSCGIISFVSLIVACCMSGKKRTADTEKGLYTSMIADPEAIGYLGKVSPVIHVSETTSDQQSPGFMSTRY